MRSSCLLSILALIITATAQVPSTLHHQGRIAVDNVNFNGTAFFKFLLYHGPSPGTITTPLWNSDNSSPANGNEPSSDFKVAITNGLYSVNLGESPDQQPITNNLVPASGNNLYLRIWFNDGTNGSQLLSPDKPITSVPFALQAANVPENSITEDNLAFSLPPAYATNPLVLAGYTTTTDISNNSHGGFIQFPKNFPSVPTCIAGIDETINDNGATWLRQERPARANEIAFRTDNPSDRIHWFAIEPGTHTISNKTIIAGHYTGLSSNPTISFPQPFSAPPIVFLMVSAPTGIGATYLRLNSAATNNNFTVFASGGPLEFYWIALDEGEYEHGRFRWYAKSETISTSSPTLAFPSGFNTTEQNPGLITTIGSGASWSRIQALEPQSATIRIGGSSAFINYLIFLEDK